MERHIVVLVCFLVALQHLTVQGDTAEVLDGNDLGDGFQIQPRIVGGREVVSRVPHQVAVEVRLWNQEIVSALCGGSLISDSFVLTAAQCVDKVTRPIYEVRVTAGGVFYNANVTDGQTSPAKNLFVHPQWNNQTLENDIAIVQAFPFPLILGTIQPIRLPSKRQAIWSFWAWSATVSGWGKVSTYNGSNTTVLHAVESRILKNIYCKFRYSSELVRDTHICTSGAPSRGICRGDEGGPLFVKEMDQKLTLLGIASFKGFPGMVCETSMPSVFTRVAAYLDWIHEKTQITLRI